MAFSMSLFAAFLNILNYNIYFRCKHEYTERMNSIGQFLREKRQERGLSLKEAATLSGLTDTKIQRIENDAVVEASPSAIKSLCSLYETPVIPIYLELGWISQGDLENNSYCFDGASRLNQEERQHIQEQIVFLLNHRRSPK